MTVNQALDKLFKVKNPNLAQQDLMLSLKGMKRDPKLGGRTKLANTQEIKNIIEFGNKYGEDEQALAKERLRIKKEKRKKSWLWNFKQWFS